MAVGYGYRQKTLNTTVSGMFANYKPTQFNCKCNKSNMQGHLDVKRFQQTPMKLHEHCTSHTLSGKIQS